MYKTCLPEHTEPDADEGTGDGADAKKKKGVFGSLFGKKKKDAGGAREGAAPEASLEDPNTMSIKDLRLHLRGEGVPEETIQVRSGSGGGGVAVAMAVAVAG